MICSECKSFFTSFKSLQAHLKIVHKFHSLSIYSCHEISCFRKFSSLRSFRNHCSLKHTESNQNVNSCIAKDGPCVEYEVQDAASEEFLNENKPDENNFDNFTLHFKKELLLFISKLYSLSHLPKTYIQLIINYLSELIFSTLEILENFITDNLTMPDHFKISILNFSLLKNPFESYKSEYLRVKEMESTENFIKPITYNNGECLTDVRSKQNILYKSVTVTAQFIPLRIQLKKFFDNGTFYSAIQNYLGHINQQQLDMSNIMQSALWNKIKCNFTGKTVFPLLLYYDDYETGNALGSHAGVHKLGAIYISLPCLPPQYSSKLNNIFLAILFHANDRKDFGNRAVLKILLDELSFLENNGIEISTGTKTEKIYFALALVLGDNLGMNSILGFNESFVANYFCRICKMSKDNTFFSCSQDSLLLRNSLNYEHDLLEIHDNSKTGIKEECVFHVLNNYHLTKNISVDPMHDLLEGICHYDLILILHNFVIEKKYISLDNINYKLKIFNYEFNEVGNRPSPLSGEFYKKTKLPFSASEMLCFVRIFSFLVGEFIPSNNTYWELYKYLKIIIELVLKESISPEDIDYLKCCIFEHNKLYLRLSKKHLTPKFHFLTHYPYVISQIGPLGGNIWSMRYESKHQESKRTGNVTCNRKNITYSLAMKHQLKVCYRLISKEIFSPDFSFSSLNLISNLNDFLNFFGPLEEIFFSIPWFSCNWIIHQGYKYKFNTVFLTHSDDLLPQFGIVTNILLSSQNHVCFMLKVFETDCFNEHFLAYEAHLTDISTLTFIDNIMDYKPCLLKQINEMYLLNN